MKKRKILSVLLAAAMTCAMCLSVGAADVPADSVDGYPTNANGETYGSYLDRHKYGYAPDLIAALGDDGTEGYIRREQREIDEMRRLENRLLPPDAPYAAIHGLRKEAQEKLARVRPRSIGQASRISGVSPADVSVLIVWSAAQTRGGSGECE